MSETNVNAQDVISDLLRQLGDKSLEVAALNAQLQAIKAEGAEDTQ